MEYEEIPRTRVVSLSVLCSRCTVIVICLLYKNPVLTVGSLPGNIKKNRYKDILPYEVQYTIIFVVHCLLYCTVVHL